MIGSALVGEPLTAWEVTGWFALCDGLKWRHLHTVGVDQCLMPGAGARDLAEHMVQQAQPRSNSPTTSYGRAGLAKESAAWASAPKSPRVRFVGEVRARSPPKRR